MTIAVALLLGVLQTPAVSEPVDISVAQLSQRLEQMDGRMVRVRGWLDCDGWGCTIRIRPPSRSAGPFSSIVVGDNDAIRPSFVDAAGREVVIEGHATAACRREICTDHGPELMPTRIVRIFGAPRATAKDR